MICRTPEEAFRAGREGPCEHGIAPIGQCPDCALTADEITRIAALLRPYVAPTSPDSEAA